MLNTKERSFLKAMAAKQDAIFQIGKSGVSPEIVDAVSDALEKRELVKINVLSNSYDDSKELKEFAQTIADRTRSEVVQVIGHKIVLYRQSKKKIIELPKFKKNNNGML